MRVAATNKGDLSFSAPPAEKDKAAQQTHYNWGEVMNEISPNLHPIFELDPLTGTKRRRKIMR